MSKGSGARPYSVTRDEFASKFDAIFGKKRIGADGAELAVQVGKSSADRSAAKSEAHSDEHQSAPLPNSQSQ